MDKQKINKYVDKYQDWLKFHKSMGAVIKPILDGDNTRVIAEYKYKGDFSGKDIHDWFETHKKANGEITVSKDNLPVSCSYVTLMDETIGFLEMSIRMIKVVGNQSPPPNKGE